MQNTTGNKYLVHLRSQVAHATTELHTLQRTLADYEGFLKRDGQTIEASTQTLAHHAPPVATPATKAVTSGKVKLKLDGSPRKKPGPPKGYHAASTKARATSSKKAAQPAKVKAKSVKTHLKPGPKPARDTGKPSLINAIQQVMGTKTMNAEAVFANLEAKGWLPESNDPKGYVRYTLSSKKEIFLRVKDKRGFYHLDQNKKPAVAPERKSTKAVVVAPESSTNVVAKAADSTQTLAEDKSVDEILEESGIDLSGSNPFESTTPAGG